MDTGTLSQWRSAIKRILSDFAAIPFPQGVHLKAKTVFDDATNSYLVVMEGWKDVLRLHGCLAHIEIKGDKIWIQQDGTEDGLAAELMQAGISKDRIVLGFKTPETRELSGFAVA